MRGFAMVIVMMMYGKKFLRFSLLFLLAATSGQALASAPAAADQEQGTPPAAGQRPGPNDGRGRPLLGKITAINKGSWELAQPDGTTVAVQLTDKTQYRKDRQGAKLADLKVGDMEFVRRAQNPPQSGPTQ